MEYKILKIGEVDKGYGNEGIILDRIFSIERTDEDTFDIREECDAWFTKELTKEELLLMLDEIKHWINEQT